MMTSSSHKSGTDRCGEVVQSLEDKGLAYDVVVNLQGDEPFVDSKQIALLVDAFKNQSVEIATLATRLRSTEELLSPDNVKVVSGADSRALYFSRQPIPYMRGTDVDRWVDEGAYYKHIGIYAFRTDTLRLLCQLEEAPLEKTEKLEQLRWLSAGYCIRVYETDHANIGIDTPADLAMAEAILQKENNIKI